MGARLGIVAGMRSELAALGRWTRDPRIAAAVSGTRPAQAEAEARLLAGQGVRLLVSWGIAAGLEPSLSPGALILGREAVDEAGGRWSLRAPAAPVQAARTRILGVDRPLLTPAQKALAAASGAAAADMETHRIARAAAGLGLPATAVRAVADPADGSVPPLAAEAVDARGRPRIGRVLAGLAADPRALPGLVRLKRESDAAHAALAQAADVVIEALLEES